MKKIQFALQERKNQEKSRIFDEFLLSCKLFLAKKAAGSNINLNLYHYAGNNPVRYLDPDGRELYVDGDETYRTKVLQDIQQLVPNAKWDPNREGYIILGGENKGNSENADSLFSEIINDKNNKVIVGYDKNFKNDALGLSVGGNGADALDSIGKERVRNKIPTDAYVNYNPDDKSPIDEGNGESWIREPYFGLTHELIHGYHIIKGKKSPSIRTEEIDTCLLTNKIIEDLRKLKKTSTRNRRTYLYQSQIWKIQ